MLPTNFMDKFINEIRGRFNIKLLNAFMTSKEKLKISEKVIFLFEKLLQFVNQSCYVVFLVIAVK